MNLCIIKSYLFLFLTAGFLCAAASSVTLPDREPALLEITLEQHQTLWDIASKHAGDGQDIRKYIYEIRQLNGISDPAGLQPGQVIRLPAL